MADGEAMVAADRVGGVIDVIRLPRGRGKTTRLLQWMSEASPNVARVVLFHSDAYAMQVYRSTFDEITDISPFESWQFCGPKDLDTPVPLAAVVVGRKLEVHLAIDDLDLQLQRIFGIDFPIDVVTLSEP